jgi:hypothetical protein
METFINCFEFLLNAYKRKGLLCENETSILIVAKEKTLRIKLTACAGFCI